ncbi:MAG: hypothetical protein K8I27_06060 [Planctomycetes bacterium]|nr:hypothetical protein [Planctomycetota bacterium]
MDEVVRGLGMDAAELKRLARPRPVPQTRVTQYRDRRAEAVQQVVDVRAALTKSELLWVILIVWFIGPFCGFGLIAGIAMIVVGTSELSRVNELMATGQPVEAQIISAFPEDSSDEGGTSTHYKVEVRFPPHVKGGASDTKVVRRATFDRFREASETKPMAAALLVAPGPDGDWIVEQDVGSVRRDAWVFLGIGSALLSGTTVVPIAAILVYIRRRRRKLAKPTRNYATESDPEESETRARLDEYR